MTGYKAKNSFGKKFIGVMMPATLYGLLSVGCTRPERIPASSQNEDIGSITSSCYVGYLTEEEARQATAGPCWNRIPPTRMHRDYLQQRDFPHSRYR